MTSTARIDIDAEDWQVIQTDKRKLFKRTLTAALLLFALPHGMTIAAHMCRGNVGEGVASAGYDLVAERAFSELDVDGFLLEYDTPRAGDFAPLRFVTKGKIVALGLVSTKLPGVESPDELRRRIDQAANVLPLEQLALCPQCGFASGFRTDRMTIADEERKLSNLVEVARRTWN